VPLDLRAVEDLAEDLALQSKKSASPSAQRFSSDLKLNLQWYILGADGMRQVLSA
jgi:hypothetical protein